MKSYIKNLIELKLLSGNGFALDLGSGTGEDAIELEKLGYEVTVVDNHSFPSFKPKIPTIKKDIRDFNIEKNKYSFINCNNVLPFLSLEEANSLLKRIRDGLAPDGVAHFTLFGINDGWFGKKGIHFRSYEEASLFVDSLGLFLEQKSTLEGWDYCQNGTKKYWNIHSFVLRKI